MSHPTSDRPDHERAHSELDDVEAHASTDAEYIVSYAPAFVLRARIAAWHRIRKLRTGHPLANPFGVAAIGTLAVVGVSAGVVYLTEDRSGVVTPDAPQQVAAGRAPEADPTDRRDAPPLVTREARAPARAGGPPRHLRRDEPAAGRHRRLPSPARRPPAPVLAMVTDAVSKTGADTVDTATGVITYAIGYQPRHALLDIGRI